MQNKVQNNCNSICSQLFLPRRSGLPRRPSSSTARFHIFRGDDRCVVLKLLEYTGQHCPIEKPCLSLFLFSLWSSRCRGRCHWCRHGCCWGHHRSRGSHHRSSWHSVSHLRSRGHRSPTAGVGGYKGSGTGTVGVWIIRGRAGIFFTGVP